MSHDTASLSHAFCKQGAQDDDGDIDWNDLPFAMPVAVPTQEQKAIRSAGSVR
jgi:hypothetical protein